MNICLLFHRYKWHPQQKAAAHGMLLFKSIAFSQNTSFHFLYFCRPWASPEPEDTVPPSHAWLMLLDCNSHHHGPLALLARSDGTGVQQHLDDHRLLTTERNLSRQLLIREQISLTSFCNDTNREPIAFQMWLAPIIPGHWPLSGRPKGFRMWFLGRVWGVRKGGRFIEEIVPDNGTYRVLSLPR